MKISIKTLQNKNISLEIADLDNVASIKKKLQDEYKIGPCDNQTLIYKGRILKDEQNLIKDFSAKENDLVVVMITKKKTQPEPVIQQPTPTVTQIVIRRQRVSRPSEQSRSAVQQTAPVVESEFRASSDSSHTNQTDPPRIVNPNDRPQNSRTEFINNLGNQILHQNAIPRPDNFEELVERLTSRGYARQPSEIALSIFGYNVDMATDFLSSDNAANIRLNEDNNPSRGGPLAERGLMDLIQQFQSEPHPDHGENQSIRRESTIVLSIEDDNAIRRLSSLGFPLNECLQMYIACERNEEAAANLLCEQAEEDRGQEGNGEENAQPPHNAP